MVKITFIDKNKVKKDVDCNSGETLLEVIKNNNIDLIGACDGACACGTCHIYIDEETLKKIDPASENEENVLDVVFNVKPNSRLACQIVITEQMEGAIITIPE